MLPIEYIEIGPLSISTHSLLIAIGILIAYLLWYKQVEKNNLSKNIAENVVLVGVLGGILGARLLYVLLNLQLYANIIDIAKIWEGGLVSFGGMIGGVLAAIGYILYKKQSVMPWLNNVMPYLLLGWGIGRLGDFLSWSEIGTPTSVPWAITAQGDIPRHPAQLYSTIILISVFFLLRWLATKPAWKQRIWSVGLIMYGTFRFLIEIIRDYPDSEYIFSYRSFAQLISLFLVGLGVAMYVWYKTHKSTIGGSIKK